MSDSQALFALIAGGVLALVQCFFGFRLQKFLIALVGFFIGFLAGLGISAALNLPAWAPWAIAAAVGLILGILAFRIYKVGIFGICFVEAIVCVYSFNLQPRWVMVFVGLLAGLVLGALAVRYTRPMIILSTGLGGAAGVAKALTGIGPVEKFLQSTGAAFWATLVIGAVMAVLGITYQFHHTKKADG